MNASELKQLLARKRLLIFDFDGTIVDSSPIHARAFNEAFAPFGVAVDYSRIAGLKTDAAVDKVASEAGLALEPEGRAFLISDKRERALRMVEAELLPIEGSLEFLREVRGRWPMALCTSGSRPTVDVALRQVGLTGYFDPVITANDVRNGKPHPEGFLKALEHHRAAPAEALVFEDAQAGLAAADAAGIDAIQLLPHAAGGRAATWAMLNEALSG
jgi:HAD superfamily hydrolase (TIGR01509 family)